MKYSFILFIFFYTISLYAISDIEVKTELSTVECSSSESIVYIDLLIKKADGSSDDVFLENQNYRFTFNSKTLQSGSFFIHTEGEMSGYNSYGNNSFSLFSAHDLNGTTEHVVSYNIDFLGGSSGHKLSEEWIKVGTIGATLLTNRECVSTTLLTASNFPPTVLIYSKDNTNRKVDNAPSTNDVEFCVSHHCNECLSFLSLMANSQDYTSGESFEHKVSGYIEADNMISQQSDIIYNVTDYGLLKPGFEVSTNSTFEVKVEGCQ